jgi:hypothetical protein
VSDIVLTTAERRLLEALERLGVRYLIVGMGAALLEGQDVDIWFGAIDSGQLGVAAREAGGFYAPGLGVNPPLLGGEGLERVIVSKRASGRPKDLAQLPMLDAALAARRSLERGEG